MQSVLTDGELLESIQMAIARAVPGRRRMVHTVTMETNIADIDMDSIETFAFVSCLEDEFRVQIAYDGLIIRQTVREFADLIHRMLDPSPAPRALSP